VGIDVFYRDYAILRTCSTRHCAGHQTHDTALVRQKSNPELIHPLPLLNNIVIQQLIYQIVILANAGNHTVQYIGFDGCPIKEFGQKVNAACGREATLGYDGNSKHETRYTNDLLSGGLPFTGAIHFKPIMIFTGKPGKNAKPSVNHWACAQVHAYHRGFSFHAAFSTGYDARNAYRHLWALWPVIPARKARKRFL